MKKFLDEFKAFAVKGNMIDLAVGVIIGGAFGKIVSSLVNDMFMPILGLLTGGQNVSNLFIQLAPSETAYATYEAANAAGIAPPYGVSRIHDCGFPHYHNDIFRRQLRAGRHAQLRLNHNHFRLKS